MHLLVGLDYRDKQQTNHPIGSNWYSITATTHQEHTGCISWLDWITEINNKQTTLLDPIGIQYQQLHTRNIQDASPGWIGLQR